MLVCCCLHSDFACTDTAPPADPTVETISRPVGAIESRGPRTYGNVADDVRKIQRLLNTVPANDGGPTAPGSSGVLDVDGLCGPLTRKAIVVFQKKQFPALPPDGVVDPARRTLYALNGFSAPGVDTVLVSKATAGLSSVRAYLAKTIMVLESIRMGLSLPSSLFGNKAALAVLNENFHLNRSTDQMRDIDLILSTYRDMFTVTAHIPRGPNQKTAFGFISAAPTQIHGKVPFAFAYGGGWKYMQGFSGKDPDFEGKMRADLIYVTQNLLNAKEGVFIYAMIHEMAHYVGGKSSDIDHIKDRAYFHKNRTRYNNLNAFESYTNADCYAQYAWQVNRNEHFTP
jgi:peptidoglycan hydrolase-like protein with peptidoglycan-binding domain